MRSKLFDLAWLVGVCILSLTMVGCLSKKNTLDEFRRIVMGKTETEVKESVGSPKKIISKQNTEGKVYWYYVYKTVDPKTEKDIPQTTVVFREGKVIEVKVE